METYLAHHGILGMKWGVCRYQNEDGTLTEAGKRRVRSNASRAAVAAGATLAVRQSKLSESKRALETAASYARKANKIGADAAASIKHDPYATIPDPGHTYYLNGQKVPKVAYDAYGGMSEAYQNAAQYASVARAATTVASIVSGVGAVATIGYGTIAAGQLAYSAYLKHQAKKAQNKEA